MGALSEVVGGIVSAAYALSKISGGFGECTASARCESPKKDMWHEDGKLVLTATVFRPACKKKSMLMVRGRFGDLPLAFVCIDVFDPNFYLDDVVRAISKSLQADPRRLRIVAKGGE